MRNLLNTLYVTTEDVWLSLDGENVVVNYDDGTRKAIPLHILEGIISFTYKGASPALLGKCAQNGIMYTAFTPQGRYLYHVGGEYEGNVLLRRRQYRLADDDNASVMIARNMIAGKIHNGRQVLLRHVRNHGADERVSAAATELSELGRSCLGIEKMDVLRGTEGNAAALYFSVFDRMILADKERFFFGSRNRRPPLDRVNALLSFSYVLLASMCTNALKTAGLDPYVGFMHSDRSGRTSLALDLMEELRPVLADRFVLNLINNRIIDGNGFEIQESGAVLLKDRTRDRFLEEWQTRKQSEIEHPFLKEKVRLGLVPHIQAMLLAKYVRGDLDGYPAFLWR